MVDKGTRKEEKALQEKENPLIDKNKSRTHLIESISLFAY